MTEQEAAGLIRKMKKCKEIEDKMYNLRRTIEDTLLANIPMDGKHRTERVGKYTVDLSVDETVKVDSEKLEELIDIAGYGEDVVDMFFRKKYELSKSTWRRAPKDLVDALAPAITFKTGRPSFKIFED